MGGDLPIVIERLVQAMRAGDLAALDGLRGAGYVERWPQSGELVRGRARAAELEAAYPGGTPRVAAVRRVAGRDELWTIEAREVYPDGRDWFVVTIVELVEDRIGACTRYFCERLEAPEWRVSHVVRIDPDAPPVPLPPAAELSGPDLRKLGERYGQFERARDWTSLRSLRSREWSVDWPQSGERIPNHEADVAIHSAYPGFPEQTMIRLAASGEGWEFTPLFVPIRVHGMGPVVNIEGVNDYPSGERWFVVGIIETGDGRVRRETHYWARPFEPAPWRVSLVERFDPLAPR